MAFWKVTIGQRGTAGYFAILHGDAETADVAGDLALESAGEGHEKETKNALWVQSVTFIAEPDF